METETVVMLVSGTELMGVEKIREALFKAGFKVAAVEAGRVKEILLHLKPALIVANLSGCQATDLELCQLLNRLNKVPIVAIGSDGDEAFRIGMLEVMVDDYLTRPVNPRELVARVRSILRRRRIATSAGLEPAALSAAEPAAPDEPSRPVFLKGFLRDFIRRNLAGRSR